MVENLDNFVDPNLLSATYLALFHIYHIVLVDMKSIEENKESKNKAHINMVN
jgi:hypothetical protein